MYWLLGIALCGPAAPAPGPAHPLQVTTSRDVVDPTDGVVSLREAIEHANAQDENGQQRITFSGTVAGGTIVLGGQLPPLRKSVYIAGGDIGRVTLLRKPGSARFRLMVVESTSASHLVGLDFVGGVGGPDGGGGAILSAGALHVNGCTFRENVAPPGGRGGAGGAVCAAGGSLDLLYCEFAGNEAVWGGAVYSAAPTLMIECVVGLNRAADGGGLYFAAEPTAPRPLRVVLKHVEVAGNVATGCGGGLYARGFEVVFERDVIRPRHRATLSGNLAGQLGGGAYVEAGGVVYRGLRIGINSAPGGGGVYRTRDSTREGGDGPAGADWFGTPTDRERVGPKRPEAG